MASMKPAEARAVQQALAAQGGMIYTGQHLPVERYRERGRELLKDSNGKTRSFQSIWREKNSAGFKALSVADYCKMISLREADEIEPK